MVYILRKDRPQNSFEEWQSGWASYCAYLESVKDRLPHSAYEFGSAAWHYDSSDHRSPHDGWLEQLIVSEPASGEHHEDRSLEIFIRLLAAYHDGHIELSYSEVQSYRFISEGSTERGHRDWLYDEIRLSDQGRVLHEIEWASGALWLIECGDIFYKWIPMD